MRRSAHQLSVTLSLPPLYYCTACSPHLPRVEVPPYSVPSAGELEHGLHRDLVDVEATGLTPQAVQLYEAGGHQ